MSNRIDEQVDDMFKLVDTVRKHYQEKRAMTQYDTLLSEMEALEYDAKSQQKRYGEKHSMNDVMLYSGKLQAFKEIRNMVAGLQKKERERNDEKFQDMLQRGAGCSDV